MTIDEARLLAEHTFTTQCLIAIRDVLRAYNEKRLPGDEELHAWAYDVEARFSRIEQELDTMVWRMKTYGEQEQRKST